MKDDATQNDDISEVICATLRAAIFEGALKPGDKLKEDILAKHFGTSRTVVRGALSMLAQQNLAERRRNHGTFVATPSPAEAQNLLATRRVLEMAVMAALPGHLGKPEFGKLASTIETETRVHSGTDAVAKKRIAGDFHNLLAGFTGNDVLRAMLENVLTRLSLVNALYEKSAGCSCGTTFHEQILAHLEGGDFEAAATSMAVHLDDMESAITFDKAAAETDEFLAILQRMTETP
ncbi:GntR family transcriptional regulator [Poseidonocella sp. HB161398]|uniref:GntR family transcriptional regulator n=1 Tax=Poseidonocella sp. HB161398 TaxID=2320855 RepID=UPI0014874439|nr:GntR family transcriptional regulator [Poseidonocella sp. HB161398]